MFVVDQLQWYTTRARRQTIQRDTYSCIPIAIGQPTAEDARADPEELSCWVGIEGTTGENNRIK